MLFTFAFFNISAGTMITLAFVGLLLFGRDLPVIARNFAKQYIKYKKMFQDATADIHREMDKAAQAIEDEKRNLERQIEEEKRKLESDLADKPTTEAPDTAADTPISPDSIPYLDSESNGNGSHAPVPPAKPSADPLALDVPAPSGLSQRATEPARSTTAQISQLDSLKSVPPPSKIPPPI